jgi:hypothetical protein
MGLVKEPDGVDFIIQSPPLTDKERKEISEFIQAQKLKGKRQGNREIHSKAKKTEAGT